MRDTHTVKIGNAKQPCKLIVPQFQLDNEMQFKEMWLQKWEEMLERNGVDENELSELVNYTLRRRARGIGQPFFPTDDEWRRILEEMRTGQAQKKAKNTEPKTYIPPSERPANKRLIFCSDCLMAGRETVHNVHALCPVCWADEETTKAQMNAFLFGDNVRKQNPIEN